MEARAAARLRRSEEHQREDEETVRAGLLMEVNLDEVAPFHWIDEYGRDERLKKAVADHLEVKHKPYSYS